MTGPFRIKEQASEREIAAIIRDLTGWDARRKVRNGEECSGLEGVPGWTIEVKRRAGVTRTDIARWWSQASEKARREVKLPVLLFRGDRDQWRAVWPLPAHLRTQSVDRWRDYAWTVEGSPKAWAAAAREFAIPRSAVAELKRRGD